MQNREPNSKQQMELTKLFSACHSIPVYLYAPNLAQYWGLKCASFVNDSTWSQILMQLLTTHSQIESPTGIQPSMWPIAENLSSSQSGNQYTKYLIHSTVYICLDAISLDADCFNAGHLETGLNADSNRD